MCLCICTHTECPNAHPPCAHRPFNNSRKPPLRICFCTKHILETNCIHFVQTGTTSAPSLLVQNTFLHANCILFVQTGTTSAPSSARCFLCKIFDFCKLHPFCENRNHLCTLLCTLLCTAQINKKAKSA